jgi:hypothetical protein
MIAARLGKMPTTSVRRRISLFSRSCGLLDQIWRQISRGEAGEREQVVAGGAAPVGDSLHIVVVLPLIRGIFRPQATAGRHHAYNEGQSRSDEVQGRRCPVQPRHDVNSFLLA